MIGIWFIALAMNVENDKYISSLSEVEQKLIYHKFT
jgi:hypothetical protein